MNTIHMPVAGLELGLRWTARVLSALLIGIVLLIFIGEGGPNPFKLSATEAVQMTLFLATCAGLVTAWRWPLVGGLISLVGISLFFAVEMALTGQLPRGLFPFMPIPAVLFLLSVFIKRPRPAA
jgi:hypothetical protein